MTTGPQMLVSVHDVMPHTLDDVLQILRRLEEYSISPVMLLIVPGSGWNSQELAQLKKLQKKGYLLAGHGWQHHVEKYADLRHRLHSKLISKNVAEHLALNQQDISELIHRCYHWFEENGLDAPNYYVPPAWAMGRINKGKLNSLPFRYYEFLTGIYDAHTAQFVRGPMLGYEARQWRQLLSIKLWNYANSLLARENHVLRLAIHPDDFSLRLANDLHQLLQQPGRYTGMNFQTTTRMNA